MVRQHHLDVNGTLDPGHPNITRTMKRSRRPASCVFAVLSLLRGHKAESLCGLPSAGILMQWMDAAACMSAERHAKRSSVTACMDDLTFGVHGAASATYSTLEPPLPCY